MVAVVDISLPPWPFSIVRRWSKVAVYNRRLGGVLDTAERYADTLNDEVIASSGRSPQQGRTLMALGHALGWGGLALSVAGIFMLREPDLKRLLFGPFGIGLLMQIPSGALVRAGRRLLRPENPELNAIDRRRPVVATGLQLNTNGSRALKAALLKAFGRYGPVLDADKPIEPQDAFGESDSKNALARAMDQSVMVVIVGPMSSEPGGATVTLASEPIARRKNGHKTLLLLPPPTANAANKGSALQERWQSLRQAFKDVPGFSGLPEAAPDRLLGVHLSSAGEPVLITGPTYPRPEDYERVVDAAIYGMKCHGKW